VVAGDILVSIIGTGFGTRDYTLSASFGSTICDFVAFTSDSRINTRVANGVGKHNLQINISGQYATISAAYAIPILMNVVIPNSPCSSAVLVHVAGSFFGMSDSSVKVELGTTRCESTKWQAFSSIMCKFSRGFGRLLTTSATVSSQIGSITYAVSYDRLFLSSLSSSNTPCFSPGTVVLLGKGFGFPNLNAEAAIGRSVVSETAISSDSSVLSTIMPGTGISLSVSVTIEGISGSLSNFFSYDGTENALLYTGFLIFTLFCSSANFQCFTVVIADFWSDCFDIFWQELCILVFLACSFCRSFKLRDSPIHIGFQH
jgi:hypothetical protein